MGGSSKKFYYEPIRQYLVNMVTDHKVLFRGKSQVIRMGFDACCEPIFNRPVVEQDFTGCLVRILYESKKTVLSQRFESLLVI